MTKPRIGILFILVKNEWIEIDLKNSIPLKEWPEKLKKQNNAQSSN